MRRLAFANLISLALTGFFNFNISAAQAFFGFARDVISPSAEVNDTNASFCNGSTDYTAKQYAWQSSCICRNADSP